MSIKIWTIEYNSVMNMKLFNGNKPGGRYGFGAETLLFLTLCFGGFLLALVGQVVLMSLCASSLSQSALLQSVQWCQSILLMLLPALCYTALRREKGVWADLRLKGTQISVLFLALVVIVVALPFLEWLAMACRELPLPKQVEALANQLIEQNEAVMKVMLTPGGFSGWFGQIALVVLATAFVEEVMFRGALYNLITFYSRRPYWTAFVIGFIFSAIHFDIYGFIPRLVLGFILTIMVYWSGSLWPSILVHAVNNLVALIEFKLLSADDRMSEMIFAPWVVVVSFVLMIVLLLMVKNISSHRMCEK